MDVSWGQEVNIYILYSSKYTCTYTLYFLVKNKFSVDIVNVIGKLIICEGFNVFMTEKVPDRSLFRKETRELYGEMDIGIVLKKEL